MQILQNVLHSLTKRKKQAGKVTVTAAVAAVFIAVIVVSANGILSYQKAVTKKTFGGWFIMENSSNGIKDTSVSGRKRKSCEYGSIQCLRIVVNRDKNRLYGQYGGTAGITYTVERSNAAE